MGVMRAAQGHKVRVMEGEKRGEGYSKHSEGVWAEGTVGDPGFKAPRLWGQKPSLSCRPVAPLASYQPRTGGWSLS